MATNPQRYNAILDSVLECGQHTDKSVMVDSAAPQPISSSDPSQDDEEADDEQSPPDGFTKVVSKAHKRLAKKRLLQELSDAPATTKSSSVHVRWSADRLCSVINDTQRSRSQKHVETGRSSTNPSSSSGSGGVGGSRSTDVTGERPQKAKLYHTKPTFMGPPLCLSNKPTTPSIASAVQSTTMGVDGKTSDAGVRLPKTTFTTVTTTAATPRTWSKVVGTKSSTKTDSDTNSSGEANATVPVCSLTSCNPAVTASPPQSVVASLRTGGESLATTSPPTVVTATTSPIESDRPPYVSLKPFWPSESPSSLMDDENKTMHSEHHSVVDVSRGTVSVAETLITTSPISASVSVTNNICKVRPQQQQQQSIALNTVVVSSVLSPPNRSTGPPLLSDGGGGLLPAESTSHSEQQMDNDQIANEFATELGRHRGVAVPSTHHSLLSTTTQRNGAGGGLHSSSSWATTSSSNLLPSSSSGGYGSSKSSTGIYQNSVGLDRHFPNFWTPHALLEAPVSVNTSASTPLQYPPQQMQQQSDVLSNLFANSRAMTDNSSKTQSLQHHQHPGPQMITRYRNYPPTAQQQQHFGNSSAMMQSDPYGATAFDNVGGSLLGGDSVIKQQQTVTHMQPHQQGFHHLPLSSVSTGVAGGGGSIYVTPQQHSFNAVTLPPPPPHSHLTQSIATHQRYRPRLPPAAAVPHPMDSYTAAANGFMYAAELQVGASRVTISARFDCAIVWSLTVLCLSLSRMTTHFIHRPPELSQPPLLVMHSILVYKANHTAITRQLHHR